jgi:hypothetical protein
MTDFSCYPCWDPAVAATTLSTEAVSPSASVFFATHAPLRIHRSLADGRRPDTPGVQVDEEEVRRDFLTRPTASGILFMPVIGQSGTGKSHLIRWIKEKTPTTDRRQVIYLQKTRTSLKAVVETLLAEVAGSELAQLKADVGRMSSELDQAGLERRLLSHLHEAVAAAEPAPGQARVLAGPAGLAVLLLDPHVRGYLLRPGSLVPRLAAHLLADRREGDPDRPLTFTTDDLPLDILDVQKASDVAQKRLMLIKSRTELQDAAVAMLNDQLPVAVTNAANIGTGRLQNAMLDIRREFARQGKEIVLLIEDFALIQGIQRDLLDAVIEVGERDGRTVLAPVRTLMAVTTGYYGRLADTVLTRAKAATPYVYDLDVQFDPSDAGMAGVTAFVGRYLNAARIGRDALDAARVRSSENVPNACDGCGYRQECHPAFGSSSEGHGIYPFNPAALRRAIRARPAHDSPTAFNPRAVIGEVVRNVLVEHAESLAGGTFPDGGFRAEYPTPGNELPLPAVVRDTLDDLDPLDPQRRATFLELWGDAPPRPVNLSPVLHHAFDISLLELDAAETTLPERAREPLSRTPSPARDLPNSAQRMIQDVEEWASRGHVLHQNTAGALRGIIRDAVVRRCMWNDPLMSEPQADVLRRAWPAKSVVVSIEGAAAENLPGTAEAPIKFSRNAANAVFFQGLLRAQAGKLPGAAEQVRLLYEIADRHQGNLKREVRRVQSAADPDLVMAIRASLIGAALAGQAWPGMDEAGMLGVVLDEGLTWAYADAAMRTPEWLSVLERHSAARPDLVSAIRSGFGVSRGVTGGVRMIDAARAVPLLRAAAESWEWRTPDSEPAPWVRKAVARFTEWDNLIDGQITLLTRQLSRLRSFLPQGTRLSETLDAVGDALTAAIVAGHGPEDRERFEAMIKDAGARDWRAVDRLESDLDRACSPGQPQERQRAARITAAVRDRGPDLKVILDFLASSDQWLTGTLEAAAMREGGAGEAAAAQVQDLLHQWAAIGGRGQE